jgi:RNA recognition motif-containing protein
MSTKLYVGNISFSTTEGTLRTLFEGDGRKVEEVAVVKDRDTGQPRGFAFVQMGTVEDAKTAIEKLNGYEVDGRTINVNEARSKAPGGGRDSR